MSGSLRFMIILAVAANGGGLPGAETQHSFTNRLAQEKSPYLLQHAHNPVDWFPWGPEAFEKARRENKPIFLSVGYATCHWCHVMERECFENKEIAALMNRHFVNIKVDREERPDIDRIYMAFLMGTTGRGGWPMNVWLTPDRQPIFGGTYFPPEDRNGLPGFPSAIRQLATAWEQQRDKIVASSKELTRQLREQSNLAPGTTNAVDRAVLDQTYTELKATFEPRFGGFGRAPKFPRPATLNFMQRYYARTGTQDAREMALFTLRQMAAGGMHDQLGGGFHRYSVDERWHVPHFEKMLYDQAQLACAYLEAHQVTREGFYATIARGILDYVLRDLTGGEGQFYSAEDADSPLPGAPGTHAEGAFYVWAEPEIKALLGATAADIFNYHYGVEPGGNVKSDPHEEFRQKNILFLAHPPEDTARRFDKSPDQIETLLRESRQKLLATRARRPRPLRDDKTLTAWNGLMISAFARAHQVLGDPQYLAAAERAAGFIKTRLYDAKTQKLLRRHRAGESAIDGFVDDYSYLIQGLLDLYEASFRVAHLSWALELQTKQDALFWDDKAGGYFSTTDHDPTVLVRMKETYDGAEPSPNSVAALNLLRLAQMLDHAPAHQRAQKIFAAFSQLLTRSPDAVPQLVVALDFHLAKPKQIVIAGHPDAPDTRAMVRAVHEQFVPDKIMLLADNAAGQEYLGKRLAFIKAVKMISGQATAYVCRNYVCQLPTTNLTVMTKLLAEP